MVFAQHPNHVTSYLIECIVDIKRHMTVQVSLASMIKISTIFLFLRYLKPISSLDFDIASTFSNKVIAIETFQFETIRAIIGRPPKKLIQIQRRSQSDQTITVTKKGSRWKCDGSNIYNLKIFYK
ncbi:Uncharacterised protein at_DN2581 [Pycnogonum litorale]